MKTTHEKLITSLLALGLVGVSPVGAQSQNSFNTNQGVTGGLTVTNVIFEDVDNDGNLDVIEADLDGDGNFDTVNETAIVEAGAGGLDAQGNPIDIDYNNDGLITIVPYAFDLDGDGALELGLEVDVDGDGRFDTVNEDFGIDPNTGNPEGRLTLGEDTDGDGNLDVVENLDPQNGLNLDRGEDFDGDGNFDTVNENAIVEAGAGGLDAQGNPIDIDYNNDGLITVVPYALDLDGDGTLELGLEADLDGDGVIDLTEDLDGDGNFDNVVEVDLDGDGNFDTVNEAAIVEAGAGGLDAQGNPIDIDYNNDGLITVVPYAFDIDGDLNVDPGTEVDIDGDGRFDLVSEDIDGDGFFDNVNEDVDGDGRLDTFAEDVNGNGVLDNTVSRTYMTAFDPTSTTGGLQDLDIIVANDLFVNGEAVATENYVDAADAVLQADIDQNEADSDAADAALQADIDQNEADSDAADILIRGDFAAADANLQGQITTNANRIANNREDIDRNARGIAMVAALQHTTVLPGMTQALDLSAAVFEGETGLAINYSRRINDNVQINFGAATTSDGDENVVKAGIGWQW